MGATRNRVLQAHGTLAERGLGVSTSQVPGARLGLRYLRVSSSEFLERVDGLPVIDASDWRSTASNARPATPWQ